MFTGADKALAALIMSVLWLLAYFFGEGVWSHVTEEAVLVILAALYPLVVWLIPNWKA
jgi:hypothetical protein